jgi:carbonic anhydrase
MPARTLDRLIAALAPLVVFASAGADAPPAGPTPDQALALLRDGNGRYVAGTEQHLNSSAARRAEVASGQNPFAILLSCADSRVPVERVFDRGIGDLFVIRVAGNVSDTDEIGTIEYGVGHLHAPLVVVMGHSACGAVKAVASGAEVHGSIPGLVDNIIPAVEWVKKNRPELKGDELVTAAIEANVWQSVDDLIAHSQEIREHLSEGKIKVVGAVYDLASGKVRWLGEHPYQSKIIMSAAKSAPEHASHAEATPTHAPDSHASAAPAPAHAEPAAEDKPQSKSADAAHEEEHEEPHR